MLVAAKENAACDDRLIALYMKYNKLRGHQNKRDSILRILYANQIMDFDVRSLRSLNNIWKMINRYGEKENKKDGQKQLMSMFSSVKIDLLKEQGHTSFRTKIIPIEEESFKSVDLSEEEEKESNV